VLELERDCVGDEILTQKRSQHRLPAAAPSTRHEEIWLLGQPTLSRYLEFVEEDVVDGKRMNRAALIDEWRAANDYYQDLERCEAGIAGIMPVLSRTNGPVSHCETDRRAGRNSHARAIMRIMTGAALAVTSVIAFFASGEVLLAHPNQQVDCQGPADCARRFRGRGGGDRRVSG